MPRERRDLVGTPYPQWHRGEDLLEPVAVIGRKQPKAAPFSWLQRRTPEPKQVPLGCQFARVGGLAGAHVLDGLIGRSLRNVGSHGDEVLHGWRLLELGQLLGSPAGRQPGP